MANDQGAMVLPNANNYLAQVSIRPSTGSGANTQIEEFLGKNEFFFGSDKPGEGDVSLPSPLASDRS